MYLELEQKLKIVSYKFFTIKGLQGWEPITTNSYLTSIVVKLNKKNNFVIKVIQGLELIATNSYITNVIFNTFGDLI